MNEDDIKWILRRVQTYKRERIPEGCYYDAGRPRTVRLILSDMIRHAIKGAIADWFKQFRPNLDPYKKMAINAMLIRLIFTIYKTGWNDALVQAYLNMINKLDEQ